jgi:ubiquitin C-terminal hydrolase
MSEYTFYNERLSPPPFGLINVGYTCYFNALLQGLMSCTSFAEEIARNKSNSDIKENEFCREYIRLVKSYVKYKEEDQKNEIISSPVMSGEKIWKIITDKSRDRSDRHIFRFGQQDSSEGLYMMFHCIEDIDKLERLFRHRYKTELLCSNCREWVHRDFNEYFMFEIQPDLKTEQSLQIVDLANRLSIEYSGEENLNDFLGRQYSYVDENHICSKCKERCEKLRITELTLVPEIFIVLSKKYNVGEIRRLNTKTDFPFSLRFNPRNLGKDTPQFYYEAVAQIEYSGNVHSGHYWCICRRNNNRWYFLNDESMREVPKGFDPTANTYIVIYHLMS